MSYALILTKGNILGLFTYSDWVNLRGLFTYSDSVTISKHAKMGLPAEKMTPSQRIYMIMFIFKSQLNTFSRS